jgi:hypothetical protein
MSPLSSKQRTNIGNPLQLSIGQKVNINYVSEIVYIDTEKQIVKTHIVSQVYVLGVTKKALGKYIAGYGSFDDYEQASLKVSKYIWLYQVRETMYSPILLVSAEDITV